MMKKFMCNSREPLAALLAAMLLAASLSGCGDGAGGRVPDAPAAPSISEAASAAPAGAGNVQASVVTDSASMSKKPPEKPKAPVTQAPAKKLGSLEAVKELRTLVGSWTKDGGCPSKYQVWMEQSDIPCGLVWKYLPSKQAASDDRLENLYQAHVDACDWSLVFDVEFYKAKFPMLALQYDYDDGRLAQHFQTVGVHEGRQGSKRFNVSAYMANCSEDVRDAFGSSYECYYFYYMLNQGTQGSVDARNDGSHPAWMEVQLSRYQKAELDEVNEYREAAGAAPVKPHPELMALASWRAWHDAKTGTKGHDWMVKNEAVLEGYMEDMDIWNYAENTTKVAGARDNRYKADCQAAFYYKRSQSHYDAMVNPRNLYFGCSDLYYSSEGSMLAQFDLFSREQPLPHHAGK